MRSPRSWNDRELLRDEPFRTQFAVRALSTKRAEVMDWREPVADYLRRTEGGVSFHLQAGTPGPSDDAPASGCQDMDRYDISI
jgi:hypothetical protein